MYREREREREKERERERYSRFVSDHEAPTETQGASKMLLAGPRGEDQM